MLTIAVLPAWNEGETIGAVLDRLLPCVDRAIVVDDGSTDQSGAVAKSKGARVVRHAVNRGLGAALATGIAAALQDGADIILTFDADGQHQVEDVPVVLAPIKDGKADVVIGSRLLVPAGMPFARRVANRVGNFVTYALFGARVTDSQSGLRAFNRHAAQTIEIRTDRMEVSSEIVAEVFRHKLRLVEVPIKSVYTTYSMSKGQGMMMGLRTLYRLILRSLG